MKAFLRDYAPLSELSIALVSAGLLWSSQAVAYQPRSFQGIASADAVRAQTGNLNFELSCPDKRVADVSEEMGPNAPHMGRGAKITLGNAGTYYQSIPIQDRILWEATDEIFRRCPMAYPSIAGQLIADDQIGFVDIYGKLSDESEVIRLVHAEHYMGTMGVWDRVTDEGALLQQQQQQAQAAQQQQAQAAAAVQAAAAQEAARAQAAAAQQQVDAANQAQAAEQARKAGDTIWGWIKGIALLVIAIWAWSQRLNIMRFLYGLTPHPAAAEIRSAIASGEQHDPQRLANMLAVRPNNSIEREVRVSQAAVLLDEIQGHTKRTQAELQEEIAFLKSQAGLADSMEVRARIQNRLDAILRAQRNNR